MTREPTPTSGESNRLATRESDAEIHPRWAIDWGCARAQSESEASGVVEHQNTIVVDPGRLRSESK